MVKIIFQGNDINENSNLLESDENNYEILGDFCKEQNFQIHLYKRKKNIKLIKEISLKYPLISKIFQTTNYIINNNINKKIFFRKRKK